MCRITGLYMLVQIYQAIQIFPQCGCIRYQNIRNSVDFIDFNQIIIAHICKKTWKIVGGTILFPFIWLKHSQRVPFLPCLYMVKLKGLNLKVLKICMWKLQLETFTISPSTYQYCLQLLCSLVKISFCQKLGSSKGCSQFCVSELGFSSLNP